KNISLGVLSPRGFFFSPPEKDFPAANHVALILEDQPFLAADRINHPEEPIVLLAHKDMYLREEARRSVSLEVDELPPVLSFDDSLSQKEIIWGKDNVFKTFRV